MIDALRGFTRSDKTVAAWIDKAGLRTSLSRPCDHCGWQDANFQEIHSKSNTYAANSNDESVLCRLCGLAQDFSRSTGVIIYAPDLEQSDINWFHHISWAFRHMYEVNDFKTPLPSSSDVEQAIHSLYVRADDVEKNLGKGFSSAKNLALALSKCSEESYHNRASILRDLRHMPNVNDLSAEVYYWGETVYKQILPNNPEELDHIKKLIAEVIKGVSK